jgi:hypothetical protein
VDIVVERACDLDPDKLRRVPTDIVVESRDPAKRRRRPFDGRSDDDVRVDDSANDCRGPCGSSPRASVRPATS